MGAATSGHAWIDVAGTLSSTGKIDTPKGELEFRFKVRLLPMVKFTVRYKQLFSLYFKE